MSRREDREKGVKLLYEYTFHDGMKAGDFLESRDCNDKFPFTPFLKELFMGTVNAQSEIDKSLSEISNGWKLSRISKVTLSILRLASYEIIFTDVPSKAVINEALEIAKKYDDLKSVKFINGILNNLARQKNRISDDANTENVD